MSKSKLNYGVYNGKVLRKFFENSRVYILTLLFAIGIFTGAFVLNKNSDLFAEITDIVEKYIFSRGQQGIADNFIDSLTVNLFFNISVLFCGFSLIGYPLIFWIPFLKGIGIGAFSGYLYSAYKITGIGYCVLTVYPSVIISTTAFVVSCNDCCEYSKNAFAKAIKGRGQFEKDETKIFLLRQMIFAGIIVLSSLTDAVFNCLFSRLFEI